MRVAVLNRDRSLWPGGDLIEIDNQTAALAKLGVEREYMPDTLAGFDLVHIYHCNFHWSRANFGRAETWGVPFVVTPIYYPGFHEYNVRKLAEHLKHAAAVMPFSHAEARELIHFTGGPRSMDVIPNGTDPAFHCGNGDGERRGVCTVIARTENTKNAILVQEGCRIAGLAYDLICGVPAEEMPATYRRYKVFATASSSERMSLVVGEALCAGCRVFSTSENRGNEWYPGIKTISPLMSPDEVARLLLAAHEMEAWDWLPNQAARLLTWDLMAERVKAVYERVLACRASR